MEKTVLRIRKFGEPCLRKKSQTVKKVTDGYRDILSAMAQMMYDNDGVGLAAPQIGINEALIVADAGGGLYKLINPKIVKTQGSQVNKEGCLSVPGVCLKVKRANRIKLCALDENGNPLTIESEGLLACIFQHEIDHLNGKLIVDYASLVEKIKLADHLKQLKKKSKNESVPESERKSCKMQL